MFKITDPSGSKLLAADRVPKERVKCIIGS